MPEPVALSKAPEAAPVTASETEDKLEVVEVLAHVQKFMREKKWTFAHLFKSKRINQDQSHALNKQEFEILLTSETFVGLNMSINEIDEVFDAVDVGKTGGITLKEVDDAISSAKIDVDDDAEEDTFAQKEVVVGEASTTKAAGVVE